MTAFNVVLMDVQMPVMDGLQATRWIHEIAPALPEVGLTAHALEEEREQCLAAGMVDVVTKPIDIKVLVDAIRRQVSIPRPDGDRKRKACRRRLPPGNFQRRAASADFRISHTRRRCNRLVPAARPL